MTSFYTSVLQRGDNLLVRAIEDGKRKQYKVKYRPYLFLKSHSGEGEYQTIFGDPCEKMQFDSIRDAKEFVGKYEDVENFEFYGMTTYPYVYINDRWPGEVQYDSGLLNVVSTDIETMSDDGFPDTETANKAITVITLSDRKNFTVIGVGDYKPHMKNVNYIRCKDEVELLRVFLREWKRLDPDIVTGWNIEFFDIPYLVNRIRRILGEEAVKELSPWGHVYEKSQYKNGIEQQTYDLQGIACLDYMEVYKKWTFKMQESYKLDHIAGDELGVKKLDYSEYGSLHGLYEGNFQKYVEYNIRDTELIDRLDDKLKLMDLVLALSYDAKINYNDAYTTVRMWDVIIHNYLMERKIVIPQFKHDGTPFNLVGGYVKEPKVGSHAWVVSFDLTSLYPHLIMGSNISPEKFRGRIEHDCSVDTALNGSFADFKDYLVENNATITPNGCMYSRDGQGFLGALVEKIFNRRVESKKAMLSHDSKAEEAETEKEKAHHKKMSGQYKNVQMALKIQINALYGALGNQYFRWFNFQHAESVTTGGQMAIRWIEKNLNSYMNKVLETEDIDYVIASDTDSVYVNMNPLVQKTLPDAGIDKTVAYLDKVCKKAIEPYIDKCYKELADYLNAYAQKMKMKREVIADKGIWTAKKRYILNVWNSEGVQYHEPKLKMMGIEAVRSSTPSACREKIKDSLKIIMRGSEDELQEFVASFRDEFETMPFEKIAFPRGVNGISKWKEGKTGWKKGTPIHVRGSLVYNKMIKEKGLGKKLEAIRDGDKIRFCYLKKPNPAGENVISCPDEMPPEFELGAYLDADEQFEKAFLGPLKSITDVIDWELEKRATLDAFFV